jgi:N6-L-threonylcarbamoyladenine synthase
MAAIPKVQSTKYKAHLPRPMINHKNYDFSFSGLKTAVLYLLKDIEQKYHILSDRTKDGTKIIPELCAEVQQAIIDVLIKKTLRAAREYKAKTIILSGGVAANEELREQFASKLQTTNYKLLKFFVPAKNLCTDNAVMVAMAGYLKKNKATKNYNKIKADANLRIGN